MSLSAFSVMRISIFAISGLVGLEEGLHLPIHFEYKVFLYMIGPTGRFGETIGEMVSQREGEGNLWNRGVLFG